jgi:hypothetical protein
VIWEARLAFILFFFFCWCVIGLLPWAASAVVVRGRGSVPALPLALATASAFGVLVPAVGLRDFTGFLLSLLAAATGGAAGSLAGIAFSRYLERQYPQPAKPEAPHIGARRPK